ncbi:ATP-binding protein [Saccharopolyspora gloriosae]|uniref:ATP-binding protein n=1 Tax=Saccharopolyspora gloriosae TaxID=455344 RepID=UPI001FB6593C|nr:ATP-binding protein [Saccharopolyspora gloriosae]
MPLPDGKRSGVVLHGRDQELAELRDLVDGCRAGRGAALVLLAGTGLGASTMVAATRAFAADFRTRGVAGVEVEAELPGAALDRLLDRPANDEAAADGHELRRALTTGDVPTLCWVDGAHTLDRSSLAALGHLARRLTDLPLLMLFTCAPGSDAALVLAGLPTLVVRPLDDTAARHVLRDRTPEQLPPDLAGELVALASGVPRALVDLVDALTPGQLCGTEPPPEALPRTAPTGPPCAARSPHCRQRPGSSCSWWPKTCARISTRCCAPAPDSASTGLRGGRRPQPGWSSSTAAPCARRTN